MLADGVELFRAASQQLVNVALVRNIKENLILGRFKDPVQSNTQFHQPQVRGQVATGLCQRVNQRIPDFGSQRIKFIRRQIFDILGRMNGCQSGGELR